MSPKVTPEIDSDWFGHLLKPSVQYSLSLGDDGVFFEASRQASAALMPSSREGEFCPELWRFDLAEFFLLEPKSGRYLEVNLAPNGAWWMCWFSDVRIAQEQQPEFAGVEAKGQSQNGTWSARIQIPKHLLPPLEDLRYNITFILNSPAQTFHSVAKLPGEQPDFHQPDFFLPLTSQVPS